MRLFDRLPGLTVAECDEIARGLRRAWPKLQPEEAVDFYLSPFTEQSSVTELA